MYIPYFSLGVVVWKLLELYSWERIALLYFKNEFNYCQSTILDVESLLYQENMSQTVRVVVKKELDKKNPDSFNNTLQLVKSKARGEFG